MSTKPRFPFALPMFLIAAATIGGCSETIAPLDHQIRFRMTSYATAPTDTIWKYLGINHAITDFDIRDYPNVDSVVVEAYAFSSTPGATMRVRLYNVTEGLPIAGSEAVQRAWEGEFFRSGNCRHGLPERRILLGLQTSLNDSVVTPSVILDHATLFLYRH